jgi:2-C-methyl-D-erythritol 4-phosphate cytidylyltransferase/2-C-methyl-D-erythritol 2,4-cyclodiphosphate synthase
MHVAAIIVAGGRGERAASKQPKQFVDLGDGRTMVGMSVAAFLAAPSITEIVVAVPAGFADAVTAMSRVRVVEGGARRQDSMANAFRAISPAAEVVVVHDAARPFVKTPLIEHTVAAEREHGAAIAALAVGDTVKRAVASGSTFRVEETLPRQNIFLAQTPQAFRRDVLEHALAASIGSEVTDEAMLVERLGGAVYLVSGDPANIKVTTADDLERARRSTPAAVNIEPDAVGVERHTMRIGTGYDLHRLITGRPLILAGVRVPFELGLQGHSDADIVSHAVTDAVLGAAAAGDIGLMFPDTDPQWKNADSLTLLRAAVVRVRERGFTIANVDVTVIAERPRLRPHIDQMRANLAAALGVDASAVSIKGKTNEAVDATGRGEAMACHAVALLATT